MTDDVLNGSPDLLRLAGDRFGSASPDPRLAWRRIARPDQLMPDGDWRVLLWRGGRGSGKSRAGAQALAEWLLSDDEPGTWAAIAPTYRDCWTKCIDGESGLLQALGTNMSEIKDHRSALVKSAARSTGEIVLHSGHVVRVD